jgi:hypothetical protein
MMAMKVTETLPIDALRPGMHLAEALLDERGQVLVPAGCELSDSLLLGLQRRGIEALAIEREIDEDPAAREARLKRVSEQLDRLFRLAGDGAETRALYAALYAFRVEHER